LPVFGASFAASFAATAFISGLFALADAALLAAEIISLYLS